VAAGKQAAISCSALEAIYRLHQIGALNDFLQPTSLPLYLGAKSARCMQMLLGRSAQEAGAPPPNVALVAHVASRGAPKSTLAKECTLGGGMQVLAVPISALLEACG